MSTLVFGLTVAARAETNVVVTWWGCMSVEVNLGEINMVFDPYVKPDLPRFHYVFLSHDHYDHCHEATLRKLINPVSPFEMLFASRGCFHASHLDGPNNWSDTPLSDLDFVPREKAVAMYPKYNDTVNSHVIRGEVFGGPTEIATDRIRIEAFRSHEDPMPKKSDPDQSADLSGSFPNLGFLVTDIKTGRSFAHTGDIWNAYPEMEKLRGKVDVLFYPLGKMRLQEKKKMMEYIRPRIAVPTHYRLPEEGFPIPPLYIEDLKGMTDKDICKDEETLRKACRGHWYLSPADPAAEIAIQREAFKDVTKVIELKAGVSYVLPVDLGAFAGRDAE